MVWVVSNKRVDVVTPVPACVRTEEVGVYREGDVCYFVYRGVCLPFSRVDLTDRGELLYFAEQVVLYSKEYASMEFERTPGMQFVTVIDVTVDY